MKYVVKSPPGIFVAACDMPPGRLGIVHEGPNKGALVGRGRTGDAFFLIGGLYDVHVWTHTATSDTPVRLLFENEEVTIRLEK